MTEEERTLAWEEARGVCRACRRPLGADGVVHHRKVKGMGGRKGARLAGDYADRPPYTVVLHDSCHKHVHGNVSEARECGLIVSNWSDPGEVPMGPMPSLISSTRPRRV